jgi:hypothetical protein
VSGVGAWHSSESNFPQSLRRYGGMRYVQRDAHRQWVTVISLQKCSAKTVVSSNDQGEVRSKTQFIWYIKLQGCEATLPCLDQKGR